MKNYILVNHSKQRDIYILAEEEKQVYEDKYLCIHEGVVSYYHSVFKTKVIKQSSYLTDLLDGYICDGQFFHNFEDAYSFSKKYTFEPIIWGFILCENKAGIPQVKVVAKNGLTADIHLIDEVNY